MEALRGNPQRIDIKHLMQFPEFAAFRSVGRDTTGAIEEEEAVTPAIAVSSLSPQDMLDRGYQTIREDLVRDLLDLVKKSTAGFFERMVVELLVSMGYGGSLKDAGEAIGRSGDGGIDGEIKEDKLGLDVIYVQAKNWEDKAVGRPEIQKFVGALRGRKATKGIFITASRFSDEAVEYVRTVHENVILIDGRRLAELMIDNGVGVSRQANYEIKRIDADYFSEE
jgi:restriction system protein